MTGAPPIIPSPAFPAAFGGGDALRLELLPSSLQSLLSKQPSGGAIEVRVTPSQSGLATGSTIVNGEAVQLSFRQTVPPLQPGTTLTLSLPAKDSGLSLLRILSIAPPPQSSAIPGGAAHGAPPVPLQIEPLPASLQTLLSKQPASGAVEIRILSAHQGVLTASATLNGEAAQLSFRQTTPPLLPGTTATLAPPAAPGGNAFRILSVVPAPQPDRSQSPIPPVIVSRAAPAAFGTLLDATLIRSETALLQSGSTIALRVLPPASAQTGSPPQPPTPPGGAPVPSLTAAPPSATAPILPNGGVMTAIIAANSNSGRPILQTPLGLINLAQPLDLPPGGSVQIQIVGSAPPGGGAPPIVSSTQWPALSAALNSLQQSSPQTAAAVMARLPQLNASLPAALAAFAGAAQSGRLWRWLGEQAGAELSRAGKGEQASQLLAELKDAAPRQSSSPLPQEWQHWMVPMLVGGRIERIRLMTRQQPEDEDGRQKRGSEGMRFLLDLQLSRIGPMQLDGLVKREEKRFDLILRTHLALPSEMRRDIAQLFSETLESFGMQGVASFQKTTKFVEGDPGARGPDIAI